VTGQGTRYAHIFDLSMPWPYPYVRSFVLADTDRLHNKITEMSARIRQLEDALAVSNSSHSRDTHPLLQHDLLQIKSIIDLHSAIQQNVEIETTEVDNGRLLDVFGTLALRDDGASTFYGRSAGHEVSIQFSINTSNTSGIYSESPSGKGSSFTFRIAPMTLPFFIRVSKIPQSRSPPVAVLGSVFVRRISTRSLPIFLYP
jgi:hypothetical protein